jgi:hypothetical protein
MHLCFLCPSSSRYPYRSRGSLLNHEKHKHPNNRVIPHLPTITIPSNYDIKQFKNAFIIQVKRCLQFSQSAVRNKKITLEPFSEGLFIVLFYNTPTFHFIASQKMYAVDFQGRAGYNEIGNLLEDDKWGSRESGSGTTAYVLMENGTETHQVNFVWKEHVYKKHHHPLSCGSMICSFKTDVQDFISE